MIEKIIALSLKKPLIIVLLLVSVIAAGVYQYRRLPTDAFPDISPVMVPIFAEAHGMAPEEIERLITFPIESAMNGLPKVKQIKSNPFDNYCTATINITIVDTTIPTWDFSPTNQNLEFGDALLYDLDASDLSGINSYWKNDTINFNIDSNGVLTNTTILTPRTY